MRSSTEIRSVEDVLVEPRFIERYSGELVNPLLEEEDPLVILVHGIPQMGVSSAQFWLLAEGYRLDPERMPAYLAARDSKLGTAHADASPAKAASHFGYQRSDSKRDMLRLAFDDIDVASERKRAHIVDFITENREHRYLLGGREKCAAKLAAQLRDAGVSFYQVFLGTFGYRELCMLAERTTGVAEVDVDLIASVIETHRLPRTPRTMQDLVDANANRRDSDEQSENGLLEDYADHLLCAETGDSVSLELDRTQRLHLLAEVAHVLHSTPDRSLSTLEAEERLLKCFSSKGLSQSPGAIIKALVSRRVLIHDNGHVQFRDPSLQQLFMARSMVERPARKTEILVDCHGNRDVIRHGAWLKRNDAQVLARVTAHAGGAIGGLFPATPQDADLLFKPFHSARAWNKERIDAILSLIPPRAPKALLDAEKERLDVVLGQMAAQGDSPTAQRLHELAEAVALLSDVLNDSELVDEIELKRDAFETAITGWVGLIGALMEEGSDEHSFRKLISDQLTQQLGKRAWRTASEEEGALLMFTLTTCSLSLQTCLDSCNLREVVVTALDSAELAQSRCASCLATWLYAELELPDWPNRLAELLERLPRGSFLRDATVAVCISRLCSTEGDIGELEAILVEQNTPRHRSGNRRDRHRRRIKADLGRYRRTYRQERSQETIHRVELSSQRGSVGSVRGD